jgi:hypothetical protein
MKFIQLECSLISLKLPTLQKKKQKPVVLQRQVDGFSIQLQRLLLLLT